MELLLICAVLGCIPAAIANSKGRSFGAWWVYGALLFIVALIHSLCIGKDHKAIEQAQINEGLVKCPYCAEPIKPEAIKCKHCGSDVEGIIEQKLIITKPSEDGTKIRFDRVFILIGIVVAIVILMKVSGNN